MEKSELKNFIMTVIDEAPEDPMVQSKAKDWSD